MPNLSQKDKIQVEKYIKYLGCTMEEALDCLEYDKQVDKMTMAEINATMTPEEKKVISDMTRAQKAVNAYGKTVTRERKIDDDKVFLINSIAEMLKGFENCGNLEITNTQREINFTLNDKKYKIVLSAPRS